MELANFLKGETTPQWAGISAAIGWRSGRTSCNSWRQRGRIVGAREVRVSQVNPKNQLTFSSKGLTETEPITREPAWDGLRPFAYL